MIGDFSLAVTTFGWTPSTIFLIFVLAVLGATSVIFFVIATTRQSVVRFREKKKYHLEAFWSIFVAGTLIWLFTSTISWAPPVTFSNIIDDANTNNQTFQVVNITAGQWFWLIERGDKEVSGDVNINPDFDLSGSSFKPPVTVKEGIPVKFVATSIDVNHGLGIFAGPTDGSPILLQMQVIPGMQNVFYYTFKESGDFNIRCLEYCGYAHPYMTSRIHVVPDEDASEKGSQVGNILTNTGGLAQ